jgi:hypothetical protein
VVTPLSDQKALVEKIISHWTDGYGGTYNPKRREAMSLIKFRESVDQVIDDIRCDTGKPVRVVVTCAAETPSVLKMEDFQRRLDDPESAYLLAFGTAWGLTDEFIRAADFVLEPIKGRNGYNHLPVRAAAAIILDRLLGDRGALATNN